MLGTFLDFRRGKFASHGTTKQRNVKSKGTYNSGHLHKLKDIIKNVLKTTSRAKCTDFLRGIQKITEEIKMAKTYAINASLRVKKLIRV